MLLTVYDNQRLYNIQAVEICIDTLSYYIDLTLHAGSVQVTLTMMAPNHQVFQQLRQVTNEFINRLVTTEIQSKVLGKNMYTSWRGEVMQIAEKLKEMGVLLHSDLG